MLALINPEFQRAGYAGFLGEPGLPWTPLRMGVFLRSLRGNILAPTPIRGGGERIGGGSEQPHRLSLCQRRDGLSRGLTAPALFLCPVSFREWNLAEAWFPRKILLGLS